MSEDRTYHMDDAVLALPPGFVDRSVHVLDWPLADGEHIVLVIQRERLAAERSFEAYVAEETKDYGSRFVGFRREPTQGFEERSLEELAGVTVSHQAFRWKKDDSVLYNHQVFVFAAPRVLVLTATGKAAHREDVDAFVRRVLDGLRLRED